MIDATYQANGFYYLGKRADFTGDLDTIQAPLEVALVEFTSEELTAFCPETKQPDFYKVSIRYSPGELLVESKSLKLYLATFRDRGIFAEALAAEIAKKINDALSPSYVIVELTQQVRGGLQLRTKAALGSEFVEF